MSPARGKSADTPAKRLLRRALWGAGALAVVYMLVEGGEFGTVDVYDQNLRRDRLRSEVEGLRAEIDSLRSDKQILTTDNKRLEHIAREEFGMVRGEKEILYWTTRDNDASGNRVLRDSAASSGASRDSMK
ncbi:MAG: septum formation initiator family protein [Gemmatimonadota bacterium]